MNYKIKWSVVKLDLPALVEELNRAYRDSNFSNIYNYACSIVDYCNNLAFQHKVDDLKGGNNVED